MNPTPHLSPLQNSLSFMSSSSVPTPDRHPLTVGLIAPPWVPVPPPHYGGTEVVVDHLARGLDGAGHRVRLFTTGDSTCPVERLWVHPEAIGTTGCSVDELTHVDAAYAELSGCDIIHDHTLLGPLWASGMRGPPVVATNHGRFLPEIVRLYERIGSHAAVVAISHHHRSTAPTVPIARVIHHGIDVDRIPIGAGQGDYLVFVGRMSPDKGVHRAINVARVAGRQLFIAAKMWEPSEHRYFRQVVEPMLGEDAVYVGQVGGADKFELLGGAEALLNPIRWPEPFGLVMIEALATGTPVLAFREGAAPEIVDHGRNGFLCDDEGNMVEHLNHLGRLDRAACRADAARRFSTARMVRDYLDLYFSRIDLHRITGGHPAGLVPVA
jgi:glycosyltransferase involved in cell wall biosynthesis